jgi:endonuclease YncB( thermonuclease family)
MILARARSLPRSIVAGGLFVAGLAAGAAIGPVGSGRTEVLTETPPTGAVTVAPVALRYPADVLRVFDGDTFEARVHVWPGLDVTTRVRLRGIDAPELKSRCNDEYARAQSAREALTAMLAQGGVHVTEIGPDKYNDRVIGAASTRTTADISKALLDAGLVRRYDGRRRDGWC